MEVNSYSPTPAPNRAPTPGRNAAAPVSGHDTLLKSPHPSDALLPDPKDLSPAGLGAGDTEVADKGHQQARVVEEIRQKAEKVNEYMQAADTHLQFNVSEQTGRVVVEVVDTETDEVVREIPPQTLNRFSERMALMRGLLFEASG